MSATQQQQLYLVSVPQCCAEEITQCLQNRTKKSKLVKVYPFECPALTCGVTLNELIILSDELVLLHLSTENALRKLERFIYDMVSCSDCISTGTGSNTGNNVGGIRVPSGTFKMAVNDVSVGNYFRNFQWDHSKYRCAGRSPADVTRTIRENVVKSEDAVKALSNAYADKVQALNVLLKRKSCSTVSAELSDVLSVDEVEQLDIVDTETLITLLVHVPVSAEQRFLSCYSTLGNHIAHFGGLGEDEPAYDSSGERRAAQRAEVLGSPIVPGSAVRIKTVGEETLYTVVSLRGHLSPCVVTTAVSQDDVSWEVVVSEGKFTDYFEPLKISARENGFTVRKYSYNLVFGGALDAEIRTAEVLVHEHWNGVGSGCSLTRHFDEMYSAWVHTKVLQAYVESILRYGLPAEFVCLWIEPSMAHEKKSFDKMTKIVKETLRFTAGIGSRPRIEDMILSPESDSRLATGKNINDKGTPGGMEQQSRLRSLSEALSPTRSSKGGSRLRSLSEALSPPASLMKRKNSLQQSKAFSSLGVTITSSGDSDIDSDDELNDGIGIDNKTIGDITAKLSFVCQVFAVIGSPANGFN